MKTELPVTELKVFLPTKDFELSKRFYSDLGFTLEWTTPDDSLACFGIGSAKFLLQKFYVKEAADNLMMHLLVPDVQRWWDHIQEQKIAEKYQIDVGPPEDRPWGIRDLNRSEWCALAHWPANSEAPMTPNQNTSIAS